MSVSSSLLNLVKASLMISESELFADAELNALIESALTLVKSTGVSETNLLDHDVQSLVLIYVKTFFGFKGDGSVKELPQSFYFLLKQVSLSKGS